MSSLAIIPARGGSKGIPNKNLVSLGGRPLLQWTIDAALRSARFQHVFVSTDSEQIAEAAIGMGATVPVLRPALLARDESPTMPSVLHALSIFDADTVVLLQPTSPLRTDEDISAAINLHFKTGRPVVSVTPAKPWLFTRNPDGSLIQFTDTLDQRQATSVFAPNGAIYIAQSELLRDGKTWWDNAVAYEMPCDRSIDIDTPTDLMMAEALMKSRITTLSEDEAYRMVV